MIKRATKLGLQIKAYLLGSNRAKRTLVDSYMQDGIAESDAEKMVDKHHAYTFLVWALALPILMISGICLSDESLFSFTQRTRELWSIVVVVCLSLFTVLSFAQMNSNLTGKK